MEEGGRGLDHIKFSELIFVKSRWREHGGLLYFFTYFCTCLKFSTIKRKKISVSSGNFVERVPNNSQLRWFTLSISLSIVSLNWGLLHKKALGSEEHSTYCGVDFQFHVNGYWLEACSLLGWMCTNDHPGYSFSFLWLILTFMPLKWGSITYHETAPVFYRLFLVLNIPDKKWMDKIKFGRISLHIAKIIWIHTECQVLCWVFYVQYFMKSS